MAAPASSESSSSASTKSDLPQFITKLYDLVSQPDIDGVVCWGRNGDTFVVLDLSMFAQYVLPTYYKHDNFRSFERQLNIYGFQRCTEQPTAKALEFFHPRFRQGERALLSEIKRSQQPRRRRSESGGGSSGQPSASATPMTEQQMHSALDEEMRGLQEALGDCEDHMIHMQMIGQRVGMALVAVQAHQHRSAMGIRGFAHG